MTETFDVVIVGGGIAGAALGTVLARAGLEVCVLERQTEYADRVRGEWFAPWGVAEAQQIGLYDVLMQAGGHHVAKQVGYGDWISPEDAEAGALPLDGIRPGIPGPVCLAHFTATEALARAAADTGAAVVRGVSRVFTEPGSAPEVSWTADGGTRRVRCRLIVGADGRVSGVRERAGIQTRRVPERNHLSGLLVDDLDWPDGTEVIGAEGSLMYLAFPQGNGRVRLYLGLPNSARSTFTGPSGPANFINAFRFDSLPGSEHVSRATVAGPCAAYPGDDTWTDEPFAEGVVLVGDAAGYSDPTIGQGLSIAMRDVRLVADALLGTTDWGPGLFASYAEERRERMRRLRASAELIGRLHVIDDPDACAIRRRAFPKAMSDPALLMLMVAPIAGPDLAPAGAFEPGVVDRAFA